MRKHARESCKACRISKVKCDLELRTDGMCSRCDRLHLRCLPNEPSLRGKRTYREASSRLSPAVRALRTDNDAADACTSSSSPLVRARASGTQRGAAAALAPLCTPLTMPSHIAGMCPNWELHRDVILQHGNHTVRQQWVSMCFLIARRRESWVLTNDALHMARELSLSLEDTMRQMSLANEVAARPPPPASMPDYIAEWHASSIPAVVRSDVAGIIAFSPNEALVQLCNTHAAALAQIEAISGLDTGSDRHQADDSWISLLATEEDRRSVVETYIALLRRVDPDSEVPCHLEAECQRLLHLNVLGVRVGPLRFRVRIVVRPSTQERWEVTMCEPVSGAQRQLGRASEPIELHTSGAPQLPSVRADAVPLHELARCRDSSPSSTDTEAERRSSAPSVESGLASAGEPTAACAVSCERNAKPPSQPVPSAVPLHISLPTAFADMSPDSGAESETPPGAGARDGACAIDDMPRPLGLPIADPDAVPLEQFAAMVPIDQLMRLVEEQTVGNSA